MRSSALLAFLDGMRNEECYILHVTVTGTSLDAGDLGEELLLLAYNVFDA